MEVNMVRLIFAVVVLLVLAFWAVYKMRKSKWLTDLCNSMETGYVAPTSTEQIKDIGKAETVLSKKADKDIKEAERLKQEAEKSQEYRSERGVGSTKKEGSKK